CSAPGEHATPLAKPRRNVSSRTGHGKAFFHSPAMGIGGQPSATTITRDSVVAALVDAFKYGVPAVAPPIALGAPIAGPPRRLGDGVSAAGRRRPFRGTAAARGERERRHSYCDR